ncbi:MAG: RsiV family protein [Lachnospiraceae bacterium]|nr:RsiV family protein [Lachnospiraceae bacterium]
MKQSYMEIKPPEDGKERLQKVIASARKKKRRQTVFRYLKNTGLSMAAALVFFISAVNMNSSMASAMAEIPVLGELVKVTQFGRYQYENGRFEADVSVPHVSVDTDSRAEVKDEDASREQVREKTKKSAAQINREIDRMTDILISEFKQTVDLGVSYNGLSVSNEVITNTEDWFTLKLTVDQMAGSSSETVYYYHIDKRTGEVAQLSDLFRKDSDYQDSISREIKRQMRRQMKEDEKCVYWLEESDIPEWNFKTITSKQKFYFNKKGNLVICFDEYEVAPGYMGCPEFEIPQKLTQSLMQKTSSRGEE